MGHIKACYTVKSPFHSNLPPILWGWHWGSEGEGEKEEETEGFLTGEVRIRNPTQHTSHLEDVICDLSEKYNQQPHRVSEVCARVDELNR